jgi:hypothetical protein
LSLVLAPAPVTKSAPMHTLSPPSPAALDVGQGSAHGASGLKLDTLSLRGEHGAVRLANLAALRLVLFGHSAIDLPRWTIFYGSMASTPTTRWISIV